jgi:hypothetical protein
MVMLLCGFAVTRKPRDFCPTSEYCKGRYTHCSKRECHQVPDGHERTALHIHTSVKVSFLTLHICSCTLCSGQSVRKFVEVFGMECRVLKVERRFRGAYYLHHEGDESLMLTNE